MRDSRSPPPRCIEQPMADFLTLKILACYCAVEWDICKNCGPKKEEVFVNRKDITASLFSVFRDGKCKLLDILPCKWAGTQCTFTHRILNEVGVNTLFERGSTPAEVHLLGDRDIEGQDWLLTPYTCDQSRTSVTLQHRPQEDTLHCGTRDEALKRRFHVLTVKLRVYPPPPPKRSARS
ncbi:hypothetical protein GWK47_014495 [Chionoecetes opilio]|uniref:Uncharacterized protein n=1 Tax=Chionoecetes opilio TaxID=41210 RepID=A0A8J4XT65_CHIOP|nr:hypothetical protein GWK47_014495 [Chionoecetes opilio]